MTSDAWAGRDIPEPVQREVRQRCGFGCVICGLPLYEYEHMEGWANVRNRPKGQQHITSEITLSCDSHHREKTNGLLPLQEVRAADAAPLNKRNGVSKPYDLHFAGNACELVVGGLIFKRELGDGERLIALAIDGEPLVGFTLEQGHLLLTLRVFDDAGKLVLHIDRSRLVYSVSPWDISLEGGNLGNPRRQEEILDGHRLRPAEQDHHQQGAAPEERVGGFGLAATGSSTPTPTRRGRTSYSPAAMLRSLSAHIRRRAGGCNFPDCNRGEVNRAEVDRWVRKPSAGRHCRKTRRESEEVNRVSVF